MAMAKIGEPRVLMDGPVLVEECQPDGCAPMLAIEADDIIGRPEVERLRDVLTEWLER